MTLTERKKPFKPKPTGKFQMQDFQKVDLEFLSEMKSSANWSEMLSGP